MTMTLIETKTLGIAAASIEFTSIPQDFTDLVLVFSGRSDLAGGSFSENFLRFNGTTTNHSMRRLFGSGSSVGSDTAANIVFNVPRGGATANTFGNAAIYIPNYAGGTNKLVSIESVTENNATEVLLEITAGLFSNTAAITSVKIETTGGNLITGSTASLYGILKGTDGIVTTSP